MFADNLRAAGNPFPRTAVAIAQHQRLPNYFTASQGHAIEVVQKFADLFASPNASGGIAFGIRGEVGSGKTHTVFQSQDKLAKLFPSSKRFYAKTLNAATILDFYIGIFAGSLLIEDFRNLASQHFLKLLKNQTLLNASTTGVNGTLSAVAAEQATLRLRDGDQQYLLRLIQADLIPTTELKAEMDREILESAQLFLSDLALAYSKILDPTYGASAVQWLQGKALSEQQMKDLGVRTQITTIPDAQHAFKFLLDAYHRADVPVMISIDEFERSVLTEVGTPNVTGRNLLKDIAEAMVLGGHLLIVSGLRRAWESLSPDFFGRLSKADVVDMVLTDAEAEELIHTWEGDRPSAFSGSALSVLSEAAEDNPRRLLEIANHSWDIWSETQMSKILPEHVRQATRRALDDSKRRQDALSVISKLAEIAGFLVVRQSRVSEYDCMLCIDTTPMAFVKVSASVFKGDEIDDIRQLVEARYRVMAEYPTATTCTVIVGYSSPAVVDELRRLGDFPIRFDELEFAAAFGNFLAMAQKRSLEGVPAPVGRREGDERYSALLSKFDMMAEQYRAQIEELRNSFLALQEQKEKRLDKGFEKSSAEKLEEVLEELTSLLEQENWLSKDGGFDKNALSKNYSEQLLRLQYAEFLDRVVPESHITEYLARYRNDLRLAQHAIRAERYPPDTHAPSNLGRLKILRDMRSASAGGRSVIGVLRSIFTPRKLVGLLGVVCLAVYVTVLIQSFYIDRNSARVYAQQVASLHDFAVQYRGWPNVMFPQEEFTKLRMAFSRSRDDFRGTAFFLGQYRNSRYIDLVEALNDASGAIACLELTGRDAACKNSDLAAALDKLQMSTEIELSAVANDSFLQFVGLYVSQTELWLIASLLLIAPLIDWRRLVRLRLRRSGPL